MTALVIPFPILTQDDAIARRWATFETELARHRARPTWSGKQEVLALYRRFLTAYLPPDFHGEIEQALDAMNARLDPVLVAIPLARLENGSLVAATGAFAAK